MYFENARKSFIAPEVGWKLEADHYKRPNMPNLSVRDQELCKSQGGRPGLPSLINLRFLYTSTFNTNNMSVWAGLA